jgi:hypothetical protein
MINEFNKELFMLTSSNARITTYQYNHNEIQNIEALINKSITTLLTKMDTRTIENSIKKQMKKKSVHQKYLDFDDTNLRQQNSKIYEFTFTGTLNDIIKIKKDFINFKRGKKIEDFIKITCRKTKIKICDSPFSRGNLRFAFVCKVNDSQKFVAKNSLFKDEDSYESIKQNIVTQIVSKYFAELYLTIIGGSRESMSIKFLDIYLLESLDTGEFYSIEEFIEVNFIKWTNNTGNINNSIHSNFLNCFSHWTYQVTDGKYIFDIKVLS